MKSIRFYKYFVATALLLAAFFGPRLIPAGAHSPDASSASVAEPQSESASALSRGRTLLKQGHADQALSYLQNALSFYTQASNQRGIAASRDALGDLYMVQGQYRVALEHYQK